MKPTVGRIVHYQRDLGDGSMLEPCAAIITKVCPSGKVNLHVFDPEPSNPLWSQDADGLFLDADWLFSVDRAEKPTPGCWNWPPREEATDPDRPRSSSLRREARSK